MESISPMGHLCIIAPKKATLPAESFWPRLSSNLNMRSQTLKFGITPVEQCVCSHQPTVPHTENRDNNHLTGMYKGSLINLPI